MTRVCCSEMAVQRNALFPAPRLSEKALRDGMWNQCLFGSSIFSTYNSAKETNLCEEKTRFETSLIAEGVFSTEGNIVRQGPHIFEEDY